MAIKQLTVFVENKQGTVVSITDTLSKHNINLRALSIAETQDFGILRLIVNENTIYTMKKIFYSILVAAAMFSACNEGVITDGTGSLSLKIGEVSDRYMTKAGTINTDEFYVTITDWNGNAVESDGVTYRNVIYKNLPDEISGLVSGPYTISVSSHAETPAAAFDTLLYLIYYLK